MGWLEEGEFRNDNSISHHHESHGGGSVSSSLATSSAKPPPPSPQYHFLCIQPTKCSEHTIPLPGEFVYLHLNEESEIKLFELSMEHHDGKFAIGLINDTTTDDDDAANNANEDNNGGDDKEKLSMYATMPLLQIHQYNRNMAEDGLGIFVVARVIGKAQLYQVFSNHYHMHGDHPLLGIVTSDDVNDDAFELSLLDAANQVADGIELLLSSLVRQAASRERRDWDDDEGEEEEEETTPSLYDGFWEACNVVSQFDRQQYNIPIEHIEMKKRSWRELKAISWAACCVALSNQPPILNNNLQQQEQQRKTRLEILYTRNVFKRLQVARNLLSARIGGRSRRQLPATTITTTTTTN